MAILFQLVEKDIPDILQPSCACRGRPAKPPQPLRVSAGLLHIEGEQ